jgi:cyanophycinase
MASGEAQAAGEEKAEQLRGLGAEVVIFNINRFQAESASTARQLDGVTGIWFGGGDQIRLTRILLGTPVLAAMHELYAKGAVLGGTSAGAAIMTDSMLTGNQRQPGDTLGYYGDEYPDVARGVIEIVPGLGFLHGTIVDQHFLRRERHNRLFTVVLERPSMVGVGIDEGTAIEVQPDGLWQVRGRSAVTVYDARKAKVTPAGASQLGAAGVQVQLLPAGSRYDPSKGRATLP